MVSVSSKDILYNGLNAWFKKKKSLFFKTFFTCGWIKSIWYDSQIKKKLFGKKEINYAPLESSQ